MEQATRTESIEVGIVGVGLLGSAIVERLLSHSYAVFAYDVSNDRRTAAAKLGAKITDRLPDVFSRCRRIVLCLPTSTIVAQVLNEVSSALLSGTTIVDTTTGAPQDAEQFGRSLASRSVDYLEATVAGSSDQLRRGEAVLMGGGDRVVWDATETLLSALGTRRFFLGPHGSGSRMKLVVNLVLGLNRLALAEGLNLAGRCGMDLNQVLEVLRAGPAFSTVMVTKGQKMIERDFAPQARLAQHRKDVQLILELGQSAHAYLPVSELHRTVLDEAIEAGCGELDNSAVIQVFERHSAVPRFPPGEAGL